MKKMKCKINDDDEMCQDSLHWRVYYSTLRLKKKKQSAIFILLIYFFVSIICVPRKLLGSLSKHDVDKSENVI